MGCHMGKPLDAAEIRTCAVQAVQERFEDQVLCQTTFPPVGDTAVGCFSVVVEQRPIDLA